MNKKELEKAIKDLRDKDRELAADLYNGQGETAHYIECGVRGHTFAPYKSWLGQNGLAESHDFRCTACGLKYGRSATNLTAPEQRLVAAVYGEVLFQETTDDDKQAS